jgi:hypothetical protein
VLFAAQIPGWLIHGGAEVDRSAVGEHEIPTDRDTREVVFFPFSCRVPLPQDPEKEYATARIIPRLPGPKKHLLCAQPELSPYPCLPYWSAKYPVNNPQACARASVGTLQQSGGMI